MKYTRLFKKLLVVSAAILFTKTVFAQYKPIQISTTAVPFLQIAPDARAAGMGNMGLATSADADASFHNLSKVVLAEDKSAISVNYTPWLRNITSDIFLASATGFYKLDDNQAVSASVRYFNIGDLPIVDYNGNKLQTYKPAEFAVDLGYSRKISKKFSAGVALRYIYSKLADGAVGGVAYSAGTAVAADISGYYNGLDNNGEGFTAGLALSNLGSKISYTNNADKAFIPANLGLGGAYTKKLAGKNKLMVGAELNKLLVPILPGGEAGMSDYYKTSVFQSWTQSFSNDAFQVAGGGEFTYDDMLNIRAGYSFEGNAQGNRQYITTGLGIHYEVFDLNFSYLHPTSLSVKESSMANTLRFGLTYHINKSNK